LSVTPTSIRRSRSGARHWMRSPSLVAAPTHCYRLTGPLCGIDWQEMCASAGQRLCLPTYGDRERALEMFRLLDEKMVTAPHHPRERGRLLDKIAICCRDLGRLAPRCTELAAQRHTAM